MRISSTEPGQQRSHQAAKRNNGITPKCTEEQIEPDHVGLKAAQSAHQSKRACRMVEGPAAKDRKAVEFCLIRRQFISEHREIEKWIPLQFARNVKSVLAQPAGARWKSRDQTNIHSSPVS